MNDKKIVKLKSNQILNKNVWKTIKNRILKKELDKEQLELDVLKHLSGQLFAVNYQRRLNSVKKKYKIYFNIDNIKIEIKQSK